MKIDNPNASQPFERVSQDHFGKEEYGYRTVDGVEEIVHIPTGKSNMTYHMPEKVTSFDSCQHIFHILDMGKREVECQSCHYTISFHPATYKEENGKAYIRVNNRDYDLSIK